MKTIKSNLNLKYPSTSKSLFDKLLGKTLDYLKSYPYEINKLIVLVDSANYNVSIFPGSLGEEDQIVTATVLTANLSGYEKAFSLDDQEMLDFIEKVEQWFASMLETAWKSFKLKEDFANEFLDQKFGVYLDTVGDWDTFDVRACELLWGADTRKEPDCVDELLEAFIKKHDQFFYLFGFDRPVSKVIVTRPVTKSFTPELISLAQKLNMKGVPLLIHPRRKEFTKANLLDLGRYFDITFPTEELIEKYIYEVYDQRDRLEEA